MPEFKNLYENLKTQNIQELNPMISLLGRITVDDDLKDFLRMQRAIGMKSRPDVKKNAYFAQSSTDGPLNSATKTSSSKTSKTSSSTNSSTSPARNVNVKQPQDINLNNRSKFSQMSPAVKSKEEAKIKRRSHKFDRKEWNFLSLDYKHIDWSVEQQPKPMSSMTVYAQEALLTRDLLRVLVGIEGKYIRLQPHHENKNKNVLVIDEAVDKLLKTLATKILSICPMYSNVVHFIDDNDRGLVNQSLAAAMKGVIKDFFTLMAQLESQFKKNNLTMQKMWYYLQPFFVNLEILKHFSSAINSNNLFGGAVLSILHNKIVSLKGNVKCLDFCLQITRDACVPYFDILEKWLTEGVVYDRFNEFMIEDVYASTKGKEFMPVCDNNSFWENRYLINPSKTPVFLVPLQEKILNTGKFLSVIRECGKSLEKVSCFSDPLMYAVEEKVYQDRIDASYLSASRQLLDLLLGDCNLVGHLLSVKHFFFMDQGDVMVHFMDSAEDELSKDIDDTNPMRLSSLLELAVRTSVMKSDPHHEHVQIQLLEESLLSQLSTIISIANDKHQFDHEERSLKGFEAMTLSYEVKWPLTLILSEKSITCYQMLFRQLFMCKYVERQLHCVWRDNKVAKLYALKAITGYAEAFALRQKMLHFVQNLSFFMTVEVIEPNFQSFLEKINTYTQLDHMAREHTKFVEDCLRDCMMTQEFALQYMIKILSLCLSFSTFMQVCFLQCLQHSNWHCIIFLRQQNHKIALPYELQVESEGSSQEDPKNSHGEWKLDFEDQIKAFHEEFNSTLMNFLQEIATQGDFAGNVNHILYR